MAGYDRRELAAIFVGGAVGTAARAALGTALVSNPHHWPWSTFAVNIIGAALLGYFSTRLQERLPLSSYRRPMLGTGVCGGLTTFSTMQVETALMLQHREYLLALSYVVASVICGLLAVHLASSATRRVRVLA